MILQLRGEPSGGGEPPPADGFDASELTVQALVDGTEVVGAVTSLARRGPGVWVAEITLPSGLGGSELVVEATFDGQPLVSSPSVPVATDVWNADYPPTVQGGCVASGARASGWGGTFAVALAVVWSRRRRRHTVE